MLLFFNHVNGTHGLSPGCACSSRWHQLLLYSPLPSSAHEEPPQGTSWPKMAVKLCHPICFTDWKQGVAAAGQKEGPSFQGAFPDPAHTSACISLLAPGHMAMPRCRAAAAGIAVPNNIRVQLWRKEGRKDFGWGTHQALPQIPISKEESEAQRGEETHTPTSTRGQA